MLAYSNGHLPTNPDAVKAGNPSFTKYLLPETVPVLQIGPIMSRQLLEYLNGDGRGAFHHWLSTHPGEPRIAWYQSAGTDGSPFYFLHPHSLDNRVGPAPDIFLFTDGNTELPEPGRVVRTDGRNPHGDFEILATERLRQLTLTRDERLMRFHADVEHGQIVFALVRATGPDGAMREIPLLYATAENITFCAEVLLPQQARISHIIQAKYGDGFGEALVGSGWIIPLLGRLGVECLISEQDGRDNFHHNCDDAARVFPAIYGSEEERHRHEHEWHGWHPIQRTPRREWDGYRDFLNWYVAR